MVGWLGPVVEAFNKVFSWATNAQGLEGSIKKWQGSRLQSAADRAFAEWVQEPTDANWEAYQDAKAALTRHSTTP